jgi:hypothetical protein
LGLGNESAGAAMVQKLARVGKESEWSGVMAAVASGKVRFPLPCLPVGTGGKTGANEATGEQVTLLLPAEKLPSTIQLTPAFFLDHLALFEKTPNASSELPRGGFATLSGFRGTLGPYE